MPTMPPTPEYSCLLYTSNTEKGVDNSLMRHKILTFTGTEEKVQKIADETNYTTRFVFEDEGEKYYYDIKNICLLYTSRCV